MPRLRYYNEHARIYNKIYLREWRKRHPSYCAEASRKYRSLHKKEYNDFMVEWNANHQVQIRAYNLANFYLRTGPACESCGSLSDLQKHHPDYAKPLETITLCRSCHSLLHILNRMDEEKRG